MKYTLAFLDTETTGNTPPDRLCQLCMRLWRDQALEREINDLYTPTHPISIGSMAIHHITPKMVAGKPEFQQSETYRFVKSTLEDPSTVMIAHNAPFDRTMLVHEGIEPPCVIDTLKLIRHSDPNMEIERHNLQYIRYYWELDESLPEGTVINPHDALSDVIILEQAFWHLFKLAQTTGKFSDDDAIIEYMIKRSSEPALIGKFTFGKHEGKTVSEVARVDKNYLEWLLRQKQEQQEKGENEEDWIYTLEKALGLLK